MQKTKQKKFDLDKLDISEMSTPDLIELLGIMLKLVSQETSENGA